MVRLTPPAETISLSLHPENNRTNDQLCKDERKKDLEYSPLIILSKKHRNIALVGLISVGAMPFLGIPWRNLHAQISPDELQNYSIPQTAQNMPLLRAATNSVPYLSKDSLASLTLVDNQAILHENRIGGASTSTIATIFNSSATDQISIYVVHDGDTLEQIADMYNVSPNTIRWANDLDPKKSIQKGQQLVILPISGVKYVVKKGDTIKSIASSFKGDQQEIIAFNGLEGTSIKTGDEIIIPNGELVTNTSKTSTKSTSGTQGGTKTTQNLASKGTSSGYLMRPVIGGIKTQGKHGHNGVDLANSFNSSILAAASGRVIVAKQGGWNGGYGDYIVISHPNGMQTLYAHLNSLKVRVGQSVTKGDVIGNMGSTGDSSGVHLHFEVRGGSNPF